MTQLPTVESIEAARPLGPRLAQFARASTLRQRIFWSVIPIILILWVLVGFANIQQHRELMTQEFMKRGQAMAASLAYSSELGVFAEDSQLLEASLRGVMKAPDVGYVFIYGENGDLLAQSADDAGPREDRFARLSADERDRLARDPAILSARRSDGAGPAIEFLAPIVSQQGPLAEELLVGAISRPESGFRESDRRTIGVVRLGLSLKGLEDQTLSLLQVWVSITVVLLVVSTLAIYALSRRITRPVKRLTERARQIAGGVLDETIPVESQDEIGQLAVSFNQMAKALKRNIDEKVAAFDEVQELNRTLEERIRQRTADLEERTAELEERSRALQRSLQEVQAMGEISRAVSSSLDLQEVLSTIARHAVNLSETDGCAVFEFNAERGAVDVVASHNLSRRFVDALEATPIDRDTAAIAKPFQVPELARAKRFRFREIALKAGFQAALVVPMGSDKATRGAVLFRRTPGSFSYRVVDFLSTLANQSKVAIDNARLFREVHMRELELETASKHKSQFLANMSHELRTPLNAILGYTELILDGLYGEVPDKMREVLARVDHNGRHLLGLINDVLDLSKIEAGRLTLSFGDYSMQEIVHTVVSSVESLAAEKGLAIKTAVPKDLPRGRGDERRIVQVLLNLVGNAIKFTDAGDIRIGVGHANGAFVVSVADSGPGISEADQQKIFQEFQQADNSNTRDKGGSGLGLSIANRIIDIHGGHLWVESRFGQGAKFSFELPVRVTQQRHEGRKDEQANPPG